MFIILGSPYLVFNTIAMRILNQKYIIKIKMSKMGEYFFILSLCIWYKIEIYLVILLIVKTMTFS